MIEEIDRGVLRECLEKADRSLKGIFSGVMEAHAELNNKSILGRQVLAALFICGVAGL